MLFLWHIFQNPNCSKFATLSMTHWPLPAWHLKQNFLLSQQNLTLYYIFVDYTSELNVYTSWIRPVYQSAPDTPLEEPTAAIAGEDPCFKIKCWTLSSTYTLSHNIAAIASEYPC